MDPPPPKKGKQNNVTKFNYMYLYIRHMAIGNGLHLMVISFTNHFYVDLCL